MNMEAEEPLTDAEEIQTTRGYQREMLDESLKRNIIVALDTGSGKTHIALLRLKIEAVRDSHKVSWFFAPNITLCEQQRDVIAKCGIAGSVGIITGQLQPDQWTNTELWSTTLKSNRVIISTPQVLLDALRHGYVSLGRDIGLIIFDEAHHAIKKHPYNRIMREFYDVLPPRDAAYASAVGIVRPMILGLTASPIYGSNVQTLFELERNLDCVVRAPQQESNIEEMEHHVHRPMFKEAYYDSLGYPSTSPNLVAYSELVEGVDIEDDPWVKHLRAEYQRLADGQERQRIDQKISSALIKRDTKVQNALRDVLRTAQEICDDVGPWACDRYLQRVVVQNRDDFANPHVISHSVTARERRYLGNLFTRVQVNSPGELPEDIQRGMSVKAKKLIDVLREENNVTEERGVLYKALVFVTRREAVIALAEVLEIHPETSAIFRVGTLLGISDNHQRSALGDVSRRRLAGAQKDVMSEFRTGRRNLIVCTAVAEEGIDIQSCNSVVRWDTPNNMVSWKQSRGRARQPGSTYITLLDRRSGHIKLMQKWEEAEAAMTELSRDTDRLPRNSGIDGDLISSGLAYRIEGTGATLSLESAVSHLNHFCAILPHSNYHDLRPIFDIDPPDMPEGLHLQPNWNRVPIPAYTGPWGATVTLPRAVPAHVRVFSVPREYPNKRTAVYHAAFRAYIALYEAGLLNENLLPFTTPLNPEDEEEVKKLLSDVEKRRSTEGVSSQMDPWLPSTLIHDSDANLSRQYWRARLRVDDMLPIDILSIVPLPNISDASDCPVLYSTDHSPRRIRVENLGTCEPDPEMKRSAQEYTRRFFWGVYGNRMVWDEVDFVCLLLEPDCSSRGLWSERLAWAAQAAIASGRRPPSAIQANAHAFGTQFSHPTDFLVVQNNKKPYNFVRWRWEELSDDEEQELLESYAKRMEFPAIVYPLLVVREMPRRQHFLVPLDERAKLKPLSGLEFLLLPQLTNVDMLSADEAQLALRMPSILRALELVTIVLSFRETVLAGTPLYTIPSHLLTEALVAPVAGEAMNYQRLEILGDTVLKFIAGLQLMAQHPLWHEGYLASRKDHLVNNAQLARAALKHEIYRWIVRNHVVVKKWRPRIYEAAMTLSTADGDEEAEKKEQLSTKVLADVIEALIGASYLHGSFDLALGFLSFVKLEFDWLPLNTCVQNLRDQIVTVDVDRVLQTAVETMLGYTFQNKSLMIEALTHASYQDDSAVVSYERMEFLGDSVLDMIVTDLLYRVEGKNYSPGQLHLRRVTVVNQHFLSYICLRTFVELESVMPGPDPETNAITLNTESQRRYLWQFLLHSSSIILERQKDTFAYFQVYELDIEDALLNATAFPWATLTYLEAPKFFSDIIESLLGAVFIDSGGDLAVAEAVLEKLGILPVLRRLVADDVEVQHPVSRFHDWARRNNRKVEIKLSELIRTDEGPIIRANLLLDEHPYISTQVPFRGRSSKIQAKFMAAEQALEQVRREFPQELEEED